MLLDENQQTVRRRSLYRAVSALAALQRSEQPLKVELSLVEQLRALNEAQEAIQGIVLVE